MFNDCGQMCRYNILGLCLKAEDIPCPMSNISARKKPMTNADRMELKPCPFCGGEAKMWSETECYGHGDYAENTAVVCSKCGASGPKVVAYDVPNREQRVIRAVLAWEQRVKEETA